MYDTVTLMEFESGNMSLTETVELISALIESGEIDSMPDKFGKLARKYQRMELMDDEGNINYIKLKQEE